MNIKILCNRVSIKQTDLQYALEYTKKHGVDITLTLEDVDIHGYVSSYVQARPGWYQWILTGAEAIVPVQKEDIVIFAFDQNEWKAPAGNLYPLLPNTPSSNCIIANGKPFINLGIYPPDTTTAITICHELMHAFTKMIALSGTQIVDQMDTYFHNENPDFPTGNFATQWLNIQPHLSILTKVSIMKNGSHGHNVEILQAQLIGLGILGGYPDGSFGAKTEGAVVVFQARHGLKPDGVVGPITAAELLNAVTNEKCSKIDLWCVAAKQMEGARTVLNNPGNIKYIGQSDAINNGGFCQWPTYAIGYAHLKQFFINACTGKSSNYREDETLYEFYAGIPLPNRYYKEIYGYAPAVDSNAPKGYAEFIASQIHVLPTILIKDLL